MSREWSKQWGAGMTRIALMVGVAVLASACSSSASGHPFGTKASPGAASTVRGLVATPTRQVFFLQWTVSGSNVAGALEEAALSADGAALVTESSAVAGTISGTSVTLHTKILSSSGAVSGTLQGSDLLLAIPQTNGSLATVRFSPGTAVEYNLAVAPLRASAQRTNLLDEYVERAARAAPPRDGGCVALLPGSRGGELHRHVPALLRALEELRRTRPRLRATLGAADAQAQKALSRTVLALGAHDVRVEIGVRAALADADAAWVASGTAVLETVLLGVPAIALYIVAPSVVWYGRRMQRRIVGGRFITLPNLVADKEIVPEYLQDDATPERLARAMDDLLADPARQRAHFPALRAALGEPGALDRCAAFAVKLASEGAA